MGLEHPLFHSSYLLEKLHDDILLWLSLSIVPSLHDISKFRFDRLLKALEFLSQHSPHLAPIIIIHDLHVMEKINVDWFHEFLYMITDGRTFKPLIPIIIESPQYANIMFPLPT
jgi:hypothetical protein